MQIVINPGLRRSLQHQDWYWVGIAKRLLVTVDHPRVSYIHESDSVTSLTTNYSSLPPHLSSLELNDVYPALVLEGT